MEMYLVKHDKEMQPRLALAFAADDKRFHTSFYRHVILNFKDIDTPRPKTVVWYGDKLDNYSSRPEMALYHLPLRILQMVFVYARDGQRKNGEATSNARKYTKDIFEV